eukprot:Trichotokara_eunicae@DN6314_c0_g2_i3.p1
MLEIRYFRGRQALVSEKGLNNFTVGGSPNQKLIVKGESQIGFSHMSPFLFSEELSYGEADKVSLLKRFKTTTLKGRVGCTETGSLGPEDPTHAGSSSCPYCIRLPYHSHWFGDNFISHIQDRHKKRLRSVAD